MKPERYRQLMIAAMIGDPMELTAKEIVKGWHWCWDWDGLLVGPGMEEMQFCQCLWEDVVRAKRRWMWYWKIRWFLDMVRMDYWHPCSDCGRRFGRHDKSIPHLPF